MCALVLFFHDSPRSPGWMRLAQRESAHRPALPDVFGVATRRV
jgi:hypothetical protein